MAFRLSIALGVVALLGGGASAAQFNVYDDGDAIGSCPSLKTIELVGDIEEGDFERLHELLTPGQASNSEHYVEIGRLSFDSAGGDYFEAVKISHLLRGYNIQSYVSADARCTGACAIAFMGGTGIGMEGYFPPDRRFVLGAEIQLTMPSFADVARKEGGSEREVSQQTRNLTLQLFVEILLLAGDREWSSELIRRLVEDGPGHAVDLTEPQVAEANQLKQGENCQPYRQWLEE
ncbi:hypothetical protein ABGN05_09360 [Aquibium sp. LZ166]|uniref:Uncharacterized protein n=1 Tax=Aquibium pacificus TaxID=3153579 RepID=A0ABV3SGL2_9HYPH